MSKCHIVGNHELQSYIDASILGRSPCAESGILFKGGGGVRSDGRKTVWTTLFFFVLFFYSPELILQLTEGVQWFYYRENYTFQRIQRGSRIFQGEGV